MTQDGDLLALVQWLSPAFPVGGYTCSHGLEWAISAGEVTTAAALQDWVAAILTEGAGRNDAILLALALRPGADLAALGALGRALCASRERLVESLDQGTALALLTNALTGQHHPPAPHPVALGAAAQGLGLPPDVVVTLYLQGFAANLVLAAVRFMPLGQSAGQAVLAALHPVIRRVAAEAVGATPDDLGGGAVRGDLAAMRHETMGTRIFRT